MQPDYLDLPSERRIAYCKSDGTGVGVVFLGGFSSDMTGTKAGPLGRGMREKRPPLPSIRLHRPRTLKRGICRRLRRRLGARCSRNHRNAD